LAPGGDGTDYIDSYIGLKQDQVHACGAVSLARMCPPLTLFYRGKTTAPSPPPRNNGPN